MADTSKSNDLNFINTFEKDLVRNAASREKTGMDPINMSISLQNIDAIGRASTTTTTTTATATTTTTNGNRTTPNLNEVQANEAPIADTRHGPGICPNPLPWSSYQHFQGPMCGCHDSDWRQGSATTHDQSETKTS